MTTNVSAGTRDSAQEASNRIMDYWAKKGYVVYAHPVPIRSNVLKEGETVDPDVEGELEVVCGWGVRTDMVNGWPRELYAQRQRSAL